MSDCPSCDNGAGSLNNPNGSPAQLGTNNPALKPYVAPVICTGDWQITGTDPSACAVNEQTIQAGYIAEVLNISGAPLNIYPLLGVHQQGNGSITAQGALISSASYPGYPLSGINGGAGWRSLQTGTAITTTQVYVGLDFGIIKLSQDGQQSEYDPQKAKLTPVGAINLTQSNNPGFFASQVKVEITDGKTYAGTPILVGVGNGTITLNGMGFNASLGTVTAMATSASSFNVYATLPNNTTIQLGTAIAGVIFYSSFINFTITPGLIPFSSGDMFSIPVNYEWKRVGIFNVIQSPAPQLLNLKTIYQAKAVMVTPTIFSGMGSWEVDAIDILDSPPPDINNIQDLFFNENRDRDYGIVPLMIKAQYNPADSLTDLSRFGLSILDQYTFTVSFITMVNLLGRPIVTGDIIEVIPDMQWDQNLLPIRKFLEVTDTGWSAGGFGPAYTPMVYRFSAQQALPSQETRDIFGTLDTQKYMIGDSLFNNGIGQQIDTTPLTDTEEIIKSAELAVPEIGSDDNRSMAGVVNQPPAPPRNAKGQPAAIPVDTKPTIYVEDALPPNGLPYGEGYALPSLPGPVDGAYFRLNYPPDLKIAPRLYRFSMVKNAWVYLETDRRGEYSSIKPSVRKIMESKTQQSLSKKDV